MATKEEIKNQQQLNQEIEKGKELINDSADVADRLSQAMLGVLQEISRGNVVLNEARKSYRALLSNQQKVESIQIGLARLSSTELKRLKASSELELDKLKSTSKLIAIKGAENEFERSLLAARENRFELEQDSIDFLEQEIQKRQEIEDRLGFTGAALENLSRIGIRALGGIGVNLAVLQKDFDNVTETVERFAKEGRSGFKILIAAAKGTGKVIGKNLQDPLVISGFNLSKLINTFGQLESASVNFGRLSGQNAIADGTLNARASTTVQFLETATMLTQELGVNANNAFRPDTIAAAAEIQNLMGLSAKEAGRLALITETSGKSFDNIKDSLVDSVSAFNRTNKTAISQGIVLRDVATTSDDILASFNSQPKALAEAASAARRLGLDLQKVDAIASTLLNFETSIENELQAQLLTGREINLNKARELALANDLAGLGKELFENSVSLSEFSNMNRIAQEGLASALGVSRQELAKIALQRSIELGLTDKALEAAAGVTAQDLERLEIQKQLELSLNKITEALVAPAAILAGLAQNAKAFHLALSAAAGISMVRLVGQLAVMAGSSLTLASALSLGLATAAIVGSILLLTAQSKKSQKELSTIQDGVIDPQGGLVVSGPKGSIQLDKQDSIVAGTNLGAGEGRSDYSAMMNKLDELINVVRAGGNVYIDGNKAGEALVLGTYKSS